MTPEERTLVCNCRSLNSKTDPAGHELWCDIGYGPALTGWHVEQGYDGWDLACYSSVCNDATHIDLEEA